MGLEAPRSGLPPFAGLHAPAVGAAARVLGLLDGGASRAFVRPQILKLLKGKVVVGHALHNDFQALKYVHPRSQTRDTTYVPSLLHQPGLHTRARVSLKDLALQLLRKKIQVRGPERAGRGRPVGAAGCASGCCRFLPSPSGGPGESTVSRTSFVPSAL